MGGFDSYSSNLSASAPPFTVDRSAQTSASSGFKDFFGESSNSPFVPSAPNTTMLNPVGFSFQAFEEIGSYGTHGSLLAQPYNPEYVSADLEVFETPGFPGYYGSTEKTKSGGSSLYVDHFSLGPHTSKGEDYCKNIAFTSRDGRGMFTSRESNVASVATGEVNEIYPTGKDTHFVPMDSSKHSVFLTTSEFPQSYSVEPFFQSLDPWNSEASGNRFQDKFPKHHHVNHADPTTMTAKRNPEINTSNVFGPLQSLNSLKNVCFDPIPVTIHLGVNDNAFGRNTSTENELSRDRSVSNDANETFFGVESKLHGPTLTCHEVTNRIKNSFESLDYYHNPTVDSPCWKGVPFSQNSTFDVSMFSCSNDALKSSSKDHSGYAFLDHLLASTSEGPSAPNLLSDECESYDARKAESCCKQSLGDVSRPSDKDTSFKRSINAPEPKLCPTFEQSCGENVSLVSDNKNITGGGSSNVRVSSNDVSNVDSSLKVDPAKLLNLQDDVFPLKFDVHSLVSTMHNLSELLLYECSNEGSNLKEQDCGTLKNVMDNLDKCIMKIIGQTTKTGQATSTQQVVNRSSSNLVKSNEETIVINSQVEKITDFLGPSVTTYVEEGGKKCDGSWDAETVKDNKMTVSIKNILALNFPDEEAEIQPQALLYKNLWLEAEAALCLKTYISRFSRIKNEIERYKLPVAKENPFDEKSPSRRDFSPNPSTCEKSETVLNRGETKDFPVQNSPVIGVGRSYEKDVMARLHILKSRGFHSNSLDEEVAAENSNSFSVSTDPNTDGKSGPPAVFGWVQEVGASSHVNGVMDRFQILKCWTDELKSEQTLDSFEVCQPSPEEKSSRTPETPISYSPVLSIDGRPDDPEASVMARYSILKSRVDHSTSNNCSATENKADGSSKTSGEPDMHGNEDPTSWEHVFW